MKVLLAFVALFLWACQSAVKTQRDQTGIFRAGLEEVAEEGYLYDLPALRQKDGSLVVDPEINRELLESQERGEGLSFGELHQDCPAIGLWDNPFKSESYYSKAIGYLRAKKWDEALADLELAKGSCEGLEHQSLYLFFRGMIFNEQGEQEKAIANFKEFLSKSERLEPRSFSRNHQGYVMEVYQNGDLRQERQDARQFFARSRDFARSFIEETEDQKSGGGSPKRKAFLLSDQDFDLLNANGDVSYPHNSWIRPGGNRLPTFFLLPRFDYMRVGFDSVASLGMTALFPVRGVHVLPSFVSSSALGSIWGLTLRWPFYESSNRDLNMELIARYGTAKRADIFINEFGYGEVMNLRTGADYGVGFGLSHRLDSRWSFSAQIDHEYTFFFDEFRTLGTGFFSYEVGLPLYMGFVRGNLQAGLELLGLLMLGYDFRTQGVSARILALSL